VTSKELCALKNSALHTHPIKVATASKMLHKLKRDWGDELYQKLSDVITTARTDNNSPLWFSTITELIRQKEYEEQEELKREKIAQLEAQQRILIEKKRQQDNKPMVGNLVKVTSSIPQPTVVVRRRASVLTSRM
jgi:hypothetical protein